MKKTFLSNLTVFFLISFNVLFSSEKKPDISLEKKNKIIQKRGSRSQQKKKATKKSLKKSLRLKQRPLSKNKRSPLLVKKTTPKTTEKNEKPKELTQTMPATPAPEIKNEISQTPNTKEPEKIILPQKNEESMVRETFEKELTKKIDKEIEKIDNAYSYFNKNKETLEMPEGFAEFIDIEPEQYTKKMKVVYEETKKEIPEKLPQEMTTEEINKKINTIIQEAKEKPEYKLLRDKYSEIYTDKEKSKTLLTIFKENDWIE